MNALILISGRGSNMASIIKKSSAISLNIVCVISNQNADGLNIAKKAKIKTKIINNDNFENQLIQFINQLSINIELIILAGFMRILNKSFILLYQNKILNIHPSLLPKFKGLNTHQRAIDNQEKTHGASVHFVNETVDSGAVIAQTIVSVKKNDTKDTLQKKVLKKEHILYPKVIAWFVSKRLKLINNKVYLDQKLLTKPIVL